MWVQLLDVHLLAFRILGMLLAFCGMMWLFLFAGVASLEFLVGWAWPGVVYVPTAVVFLR